MNKRIDLEISPDLATFVLRISLATVLLAHSLYLKLLVFSLAGSAQYFASIGLPAFLAYLVFALEAIAGAALLLGFKTRIFSALVIPVLLGATWAHSANGWLFTNNGGGWEYPLLLSLLAMAQTGLGDGRFAVSNYLLCQQTKSRQ